MRRLTTPVLALLALCLMPLAAIAQAAGPAAKPDTMPAKTALATFAGGCFWCMVHPFDELPGVVSVTSGYIGGKTQNPTYNQVSAGNTGHAEAVQVTYDPAKVSYEKLLDVFWHNVDPLDAGGQFCDRGDQYRTAIFTYDDAQKQAALASKAKLDAGKQLPGKIVTEIVPAGTYTKAEEYHQDYYKKNPVRYSYYRHGCGRDARLEQLWGKQAGH